MNCHVQGKWEALKVHQFHNLRKILWCRMQNRIASSNCLRRLRNIFKSLDPSYVMQRLHHLDALTRIWLSIRLQVLRMKLLLRMKMKTTRRRYVLSGYFLFWSHFNLRAHLFSSLFLQHYLESNEKYYLMAHR